MLPVRIKKDMPISSVLMTVILAITTVMIACIAPTKTSTPHNIEHTEQEPTRASSLPADYIAGGVNNMDPKMYVSHGGSISVNSNSIIFCSLGEEQAIYLGKNGVIAIASLIT